MGDPPADLTPVERAIWDEIVAAAPVDVFDQRDSRLLDGVCVMLNCFRRYPSIQTLSDVRDRYRDLGQFLIPMGDRRRLLFPNRPKRRTLQ